MDLDGPGYGSPSGLAARIHELLPELAPGFNVKALAHDLDIREIAEETTSGFQAMLLTDPLRKSGAIILADWQGFKQRRFSIGHELGHFLLPFHAPDETGQFLCSQADLKLLGRKEQSRRNKMEVEANEFAARLLMPLNKLRPYLRAEPNLETVVSLTAQYKVSKDAMARTYAEQHDDPVAILVTQNGKYLRGYWDRGKFPWLALRKGGALPRSAAYFENEAPVGKFSDMDEADPDDWLEDPEKANVLELREQVFWQTKGFAMVLLEAEIEDDGS